MYSPVPTSVLKAVEVGDEMKLHVVWTGALCAMVIKPVLKENAIYSDVSSREETT